MKIIDLKNVSIEVLERINEMNEELLEMGVDVLPHALIDAIREELCKRYDQSNT